MSYHIHGTIQLQLCFDVDASTEEGALEAVGKILAGVHAEAEAGWENTGQLVIKAPEGATANMIAIGVATHGEHDPPPPRVFNKINLN